MTDIVISPAASAPPRPRPGTAARWRRPALFGLLVVTAGGYLWGLGASGYANSFYAAAAWAGTRSWKALLFGSLDPANLITVDKPPAALWVMALSGRVFGFSSWSMLVPQALMGVASVALLYAAVRRWSGAGVALGAAAVLAFTPAAVLIFRYNNPDALLVLLMVAAGYTTVRAVDAAATRAGTRWLLVTGVLLGFGFLAKMLQVMLVVPALVGVYLVVAEVGWRRRVGQLVGAGLAMVASAGWYVALVELWPASSRPYIGGSTNNSLMELALGYNGLSRILGHGGGFGGRGGPGGMVFGPGRVGAGGEHNFRIGGPGGSGFGGSAGITRMFNTDFGGNIAWLLAAALLALLAGLWLTRRAPRGDRTRAGLLLWGGWLLVTGLVFSFMSGIVHPYYVVAMAPGLAGALAIGAGELWARRAHWAARGALAAGVLGTAVLGAVLLGRTPEFVPWLWWAVLGGGLLAVPLLLVTPGRRGRAGTALVIVAVLVAVAGGVVGYSVETVLTVHRGGIISAGPSGPGSPGGPGGSGGPGGPDDAGLDDPALPELMRSAGTTWSAATIGAQDAAGLELASDTAVMGIGGYVGGDPAPTLGQFQDLVTRGQVRYFVSPPRRHVPPPRGPGGEQGEQRVGQQIEDWVKARYPETTVGGYAVYELTSPPAAGR